MLTLEWLHKFPFYLGNALLILQFCPFSSFHHFAHNLAIFMHLWHRAIQQSNHPLKTSQTSPFSGTDFFGLGPSPVFIAALLYIGFIFSYSAVSVSFFFIQYYFCRGGGRVAAIVARGLMLPLDSPGCYCCHDFHIFHKSSQIANLCSKFAQMRKYLIKAFAWIFTRPGSVIIEFITFYLSNWIFKWDFFCGLKDWKLDKQKWHNDNYLEA